MSKCINDKCGREFSPKNSRHLYCSKECKNRAKQFRFYRNHIEEELADERTYRWVFKKQCVKYKGSKCELCGFDDMYAMDFHHTNPNEKDFGISNSAKVFNEVVKAELDKCILLCANCHGKVHNSERSTLYVPPTKATHICEYHDCNLPKKGKGKFCSKSHSCIASQEKRRFRLIDEAYKSKGDKCEVCGETHRSTFVFHHNLDKEFSLTNGWNLSEVKIKAELEKCRLLCHNCHRRLHSLVSFVGASFLYLKPNPNRRMQMADRIYARKLRMTKLGDYEIKTGRYFGAGLPIYHISYGEKDDYIRAPNRTQAIAIFKKANS